MYCAHNVHTYGYLLSHWLRQQFVDRLVATGSAEADWLAGFELGGQPADRVRLRHLQLDPGVARAIACEGLERLAANDFEPFAAERLPLVLAWLQAEEPLLDANQRRAGWPNLFERAQRWQAEREARQNLAGLRWPVGPAPLVFDGCSVEPIADAFTLWREALTMHHCVGTYADECAQGVMRVFHVDLAGSPKGATLALRWSASGWRRFDFKEPANRIPDAEAGRWADRFVDWYGALPDNESDSVAEESIFFEEDGHDHSCPVCGDECCADHLLAVMESGCSMEGGLLYEDWHRAKARHMDLLRAAFLAGQSRTGLDGEMDALLEAIAVKCPVRELELFEDAAAELDADGEIRRLLEERLWNDPWADRRYYIIEGMPGASSSGHYYWTDDPEKSIASFRALAGLDQNVSDNGMRPA